MGVTTGSTLVPAHGAGAVPAFVATPPTGSGPGILLLHDIYGVTDRIRSRARQLAALGYVTLAPELYWRQGRGIEVDEAADDALQQALRHRQRLDLSVAVDDAVAVLEHLRSVPSVLRRSGVLGFGLGAGVAFGVAAHAGPAAAVCYYGSDIRGQAHRALDVRCPVLFHWGEDDDLVPARARDAVLASFHGRPGVESHVYPGASYGFDDDRSPVFRPEQAAQAWRRTEEFLARTLPVAHHWVAGGQPFSR